MQYDIIGIVSSKRGVPALRQLLSQLPASFHTPIVCLLESGERAVEDLRTYTRLDVRWADAAVPLEKGVVYVSPPGTSLVCRPGGELYLAPFGPESSALQPVDTFLASAARSFGGRMLALVLGGFDSDGVAGAAEVKAHGGSVFVLDRATARYWGMAEPIVHAGAYDRVLTVEDVAAALRACFSSQDLLRCAEIQIEVSLLLDTALRLSGTRMGHVARRLRDSDGVRVFAHRGLGFEQVHSIEAIGASEHTTVGRSFRQRARIVVSDVMQDPAWEERRVAPVLGFRGIHATPVPAADRDVAAVLTTLFPQPHSVTPQEARDMDQIARRAGALIARL
ncbi:MAG TPA: chemotaxis protein CheB [Vicinamibacterales bacterium]|nr:chemotaxis protein CheB [Vicinamibacterales bacterium]